MSASPSEREDWGGNLPAIPSSTSVFWPSIAVGVVCAFLGIYLILTPVPKVEGAVGMTSTPQPTPTERPRDSSDSDDVRVLRCGFVDSKESTFALGMEEFAKGVSQRTEGELVVELLPGGLVDGRKMAERELVEAVKGGKLGHGSLYHESAQQL